MHGAKGLEFDTVWVISVNEGLTPHEKSSRKETDIEEERRLFYVAITRAKRRLYISHVKKRYELNIEPSRFLKEIVKEARDV